MPFRFWFLIGIINIFFFEKKSQIEKNEIQKVECFCLTSQEHCARNYNFHPISRSISDSIDPPIDISSVYKWENYCKYIELNK